MADLKAWNLFGAMSVAAGGCGSISGSGDSANSNTSYCGYADGSGDCGYTYTYTDSYDWTDTDECYDPSCYPDLPPPEPCTKDTDCENDEICVDGECVSDAPTIPSCAGLTWAPPIPLPDAGQDIIAISAIDLDEDAQLDLIVQESDAMRIIKQGGDLVEPVAIPPNEMGYAIFPARLDESTPDDLAVVNRDDAQVYLLRNDGAGSLGPPEPLGFIGPYHYARAGDSDGDGHLDVLLGDHLFLGAGDGSLTMGPILAEMGEFWPRAFFQGDDDPAQEIVLILEETRSPAVWDQDQGFSNLGDVQVDDDASFGAVDLDGDGYEDIIRVVGNDTAGGLRIFLSSGAELKRTIPHAGTINGIGDVAGDAFPAVVVFPTQVELVYAYRNLLGEDECSTVLPTTGSIGAVADFTGDGLADVALVNGATTTIHSVE